MNRTEKSTNRHAVYHAVLQFDFRLLVPTLILVAVLGGCATKRPILIPDVEQAVVVEEPGKYQVLFQKLEKAVFVREGLSGKPTQPKSTSEMLPANTDESPMPPQEVVAPGNSVEHPE